MRKLQEVKFIKNKWLIVILLMLAYTFSFMDRYVVNLLVDPMKRDMNLTDTQISLLLGISFALFYAVLGIPIGRLSDTKSRTGIISIGITIWSLMTSFCGMTKNYMQLFFSRMGVGIGEATLSPSVYSLIADYFPKRQWATAISIYSLGIYLGSGIAYIIGGKLIQQFSEYPTITIAYIGDIFGWQLIFFLFGIPGLLVAVLILLVREPIRANNLGEDKSSLYEFIVWVRKEGKLFILLCVGSSVFNVAVYGTATWLPTFLKRVHHLPVNEVGLILGISTLVLPSIGVISGGRIADYFAVKQGLQGRLRVLLYATLLFIPANVIYPLVEGTKLTIALIPHGLLISATVGMGVACVQEIVPAGHRGIANSILLFSQNLIGLGLGPVVVGLMNDYLFHDAMAIGRSLLVEAVISLTIAALIFYRAMLVNNNIRTEIWKS